AQSRISGRHRIIGGLEHWIGADCFFAAAGRLGAIESPYWHDTSNQQEPREPADFEQVHVFPHFPGLGSLGVVTPRPSRSSRSLAAASRRSSPRQGAAIWMPTGRCSLVKPAGIEMAGEATLVKA